MAPNKNHVLYLVDSKLVHFADDLDLTKPCSQVHLALQKK